MAPSEDDHEEIESESLIHRICDTTGAERREAARELGEQALTGGRYLDNSDLDLNADLSTDLIEGLAADDPLVRGHVAMALAQVGPHVRENPAPEATEEVILALFAAAGDEEPSVRRSALVPSLWTAIKRITGSSDGVPDDLCAFDDAIVAALNTDRISREAARVAVDRLTDDRDVIRKRAAGALVSRGAFSYLAHDAELFLAHPDPEDAVEIVLDGLSDPVDETRTMRDYEGGMCVRDATGKIVIALARHEPDVLTPHVDQIREALVSDDDDVRRDAAVVLGRLIDHDSSVVDGTVNEVVEGLQEALQYPGLYGDPGWEDAADALVTFGRSRPEDIDDVVDALVAGLEDYRTQVRATSADALTRLVDEDPERFEQLPALVALAEAQDTGSSFLDTAPDVLTRDCDYRDPLAAVADDFPEFVAERLCGLRTYFYDDKARSGTHSGELLTAVADVEPEAVRPAVETALAAVGEGSAGDGPEQTLAEVAQDHPALVAPVVDDLVRAATVGEPGSETPEVPRLSAQVSKVVEGAAPAVDTVEAGTVETLATRGLGSPDDQERLRAGRALGALACQDCLPDTGLVANGVTQTLGDALETGAIDPEYDHNTVGAAEPLAVLASDHTDFVADCLAGMAPAFREANGTVWNKLEDPLVEITAADPVAIHPAVEWTIDAVERNTAIQRPEERLVDIAETDPVAVAPFVDDLVAAAVRESPSSEDMEATLCSGHAMEAIEVAAPAIDSIRPESIATIADQGLASPDDFERLYAARALGALAREDLLPDDTPAISAAADRLTVALERGELDSEQYRGPSGAEEPLVVLASEHPGLYEYALERVRERTEQTDEITAPYLNAASATKDL